ncbi:MAG: thioredoxin fold domain-containing protein [Gammaproteobacteria bacterium]|nr:thioredoxin fold domain-containing protein [Gammaproteobacteria bacterium]
MWSRCRALVWVVLLTLATPLLAVETPSWFKDSFLDIREEIAEAAAAERRVLLYFHQDGCPYCERMLQVNFSQKEIEEKTRQLFNVIAINIWGDLEVTDLDGESRSEKAFAKALKVQFTPTMVILDQSGDVAFRVNGYYPPDKFLALLDYSRGEGGEGESFLEFYAKRAETLAAGPLNPYPGALEQPLDLRRKEGDKPLLLLFEQSRCKACDEMHREAFSQKEIQEYLQRFDVAQIDSWSLQELITPGGEKMSARSWSDALGIQYTPTLLFIDAAGKEVFRTDSYIRPYHLATSLSYVADGIYQQQPEFQRHILDRIEARRKEKGSEAVNLQ